MKKILLGLERYIAELEGFQKQLRRDLKRAPAGSLRTYRNKNYVYYYHRKDSHDNAGKYIRKDSSLVKALAQKEYNTKVLDSTNMYLSILRSGLSQLKQYDPAYLSKLFQSLPDSRRKLVDPLFQTDEAYAEKWLNVSYSGKEFPDNFPEYYSAKGERVRSKSEILIADRLAQLGIPYRYEYPLFLNGFGTVYTDFTMLDVATRQVRYLEHFGLIDQPEYASRFVRKIEAYERNGIYLGDRLLVTFETADRPLNMRLFDDMILHYFS